MALTQQQLAALKAHILANGEVSNFVSSGDMGAVAEWYNAEHSPAFITWKTSLSKSEIREAVNWAEVVALTPNGLMAFQILTNTDEINPSDDDIRAAFATIFTGAGGTNSRNALTAAAKRHASRVERVFATGTGSDGSPAKLVVVGPISYSDIIAALAS